MTEISEKLLPCPFCGQDNANEAVGTDCFYVVCSSCGAEGPTDEIDYKAVAAWNRRAARAFRDKGRE